MLPRNAIAAILVATAGALAAPAAAAPVTVEYPSLDCPDTGDEGLQECIDGIDPGSTVILTSEIIEEGASIVKSLTVRAADRSLRPLLLGFLIGAPANGKARVTIEDIRFSVGLIAMLDAGKGHSLTARRIDIGRHGLLDPRGIEFITSVPASFTLEDSIVHSDQDDQRDVIAISASDPEGRVRVRLVGNQISARGDTESGAGILFDMFGDGTVEADIFNNVISDVANCNCGAASGIAVLPEARIKADFNIVGNTIVNSGTNAIQQRNLLTKGRLSLDLFNNIFSNIESSALSLDPGKPGTLAFRAGYNDFFDVEQRGFNGLDPGPGNLGLNPRFVDPAKRDFRLRPNSPLIDKGLTCSPGGVANPEASGRHRLAGTAVDIGAFERSAPPITGRVRLGTNGDDTLRGTDGRDILCGFNGEDVLLGRAGQDFIDAGAGGDRAIGGEAADRVLGGPGDDTICANDGAAGDFADGGPGNDRGKTDSGDTRISIESNAGC